MSDIEDLDDNISIDDFEPESEDEDDIFTKTKVNKGTIDEEADDEDEDVIGADDEMEDDVEDANNEDDEDVIGADDEGEDEDDLYEGGADSDDDNYDPKEETPTSIKSASKKSTQPLLLDSDEDEDDTDENYLQKFDSDINKNYINEFHPECIIHNYDEISALSRVVRDINNIIIDPLHKTIPFLTKYEKARVLGQRAKQIESGAKPFVSVPENVIDGYIIAELELQQKKIPFIIRRPLPGGAFEYWSLKDLEVINF
jgi:DNA-directed RNA polymerase subunit K/omega